MGRKAKISYWASRKGGGYFCWMGGKQVELALGPDDESAEGPVYCEARKRFEALTGVEGLKKAADVSGVTSCTVRVLYNARVTALSARENPRQLKQFVYAVKGFAEAHADLQASAVRPRHVEAWLTSQASWNGSTRRNAVGHLMSCFNWAVREDYLPANPLTKKVTWPEAVPRGREARMPPGLADVVIGCAKSPEFALLLRTLRMTGARPVEPCNSKVKNLHGDLIVLPWNAPKGDYRWKNARKTRKDRVICLPPEIANELQERAKGRSPEEPLFLTAYGVRWRSGNLQNRWVALKLDPRFLGYCRDNSIDPTTVWLYNFRHEFASAFLDSGRSAAVLAELMGTSVAMLSNVYGHADRGKMRDFYLDFVRESEKPRQTK